MIGEVLYARAFDTFSFNLISFYTFVFQQQYKYYLMSFIILVLSCIVSEQFWDDLKFWCSESLSLIYKYKCVYIKGGLSIIGWNMPKRINLYNFRQMKLYTLR